jgi:pimeloyl-ACP methyl ester carboxylesterase
MHLPSFVALMALVGTGLSQDLPRRGTHGLPLKAPAAETMQKLKRPPQSALEVGATASPLPGSLKPGDLIVAVNGKGFTTFGEFNSLIRDLKVGSIMRLGVLSEGKRLERTAPVIERPRDPGSDKYEVLYDSVVSRGHRIRTIISRPKAPGRYPVLFWIQGINVGSVDAPLSASSYISKALKPFAEDGFVTVRVEKPGVGDSEGGPAMDVGFDEENDIYRQTLKALPGYEFVDRDRIFLFGHSMGGCHAPIVASEFPVRGIITYGTVTNSWLEWEVNSPRVQGPLGGEAPAATDDRVRKATAFYHYLFNEHKTLDWIRKNRPELRDTLAEQSPDGKTITRSVRYMQECNDKNYCRYWEKTGQARVLALFGENDWISLERDQVQVANIVNLKHPGFATYQVVAGCDHGFGKSRSMADSYARFSQPSEFNPEIVRVTRAWIDRMLER